MPLTYMFSALLALSTTLLFGKQTVPVFVIDPAADLSMHTRTINDNFERGLMLQLAHHLQQTLQTALPAWKIVIAKPLEHTNDRFWTAYYANQLEAKFLVRLHCYHEQSAQPHCWIYYFCRDLFSDQLPLHSSLTFLPLYDIHRQFFSQTQRLVYFLHQQLSASELSGRCLFHAPQAAPLKSLAGINAPACTVEIGLKEAADLKNYYQPLVQAFHHLLLSFESL
jgi:hypothetical protein